MEVWTRGKLERLAGRASTAAIRIIDRLDATAISPTDAPDDAKAWGQYVDDEHHSKGQWGFYGTSAAVQTFAIRQRTFGTTTNCDGIPLVVLALKQLPESIEVADARFDHKRAKGDFDNIIKLAFICDALRPGEVDVAKNDAPGIVQEILDRAVDARFWSSRAATDDDRFSKERFFPTSYVLLVLQRYALARENPAYQQARCWLAERLVHDQRLDTVANNALVGLALLDPHEHDDARPGIVTKALDICQQRLVTWSIRERTIVIDRPVFYGFSLGWRNDYGFVHPELLAALFLLRRGNPPPARSCVLRVLRSLTDNILSARGFVGQNGVMSTVDQMWAMRLIGEFRAQHDRQDGHRRLLPVRDQRALLQDNRSRLVAVAAFVLVAAGTTVAAAQSFWAGVAAAVAAVLLLAANVFAIPIKGD